MSSVMNNRRASFKKELELCKNDKRRGELLKVLNIIDGIIEKTTAAIEMLEAYNNKLKELNSK